MEAKRGMGRGVGVSLLAIVGIVALVGLFEGSAFAEGDTAGVPEERGAEKRAKPLWRDVVDGVSAFAVIVIGVATVWVMIQQHKQAKKQGAWERKLGDRQLKQDKELGERQERWTRMEMRREALRGAMEYLRRVWRTGAVEPEDEVLFQVEAWAMAGVFEREEALVVVEFGKKGMEGRKVVEELAREEGRPGGGRPEELERLKEKRKEVMRWVAEAFKKLAIACWEEKVG